MPSQRQKAATKDVVVKPAATIDPTNAFEFVDVEGGMNGQSACKTATTQQSLPRNIDAIDDFELVDRPSPVPDT